MSVRHTLKAGGWIDLRDAVQITERQRRQARLLVQRLSPQSRTAMTTGDAATVAQTMTAADAEAMYELNDLVAAGMIEAWSFEQPITAEQMPELPGGVYDEVLELTAPGVSAFFGVDFSPSPDPASPTQPSNA